MHSNCNCKKKTTMEHLRKCCKNSIRNWDCAKTEPRTKEQFFQVDVFETSGILLVLLVLDNHIECSWWSENLTQWFLYGFWTCKSTALNQSEPRWDQINSWQRLKMNVSSHSPICIGNVTAWMDQQRINGHPKGVLKCFEKSWIFSHHRSHKHVLGLGRVFNWDCNMVPGKCKFSGNKNSARLSVKHPWIQMYYSNLRQNDPKRQWATEGLSLLQSLLYCPISIKFLEHVFVPSSIRTSHLRQIHYLFDKTPVRYRWWSNTI